MPESKSFEVRASGDPQTGQCTLWLKSYGRPEGEGSANSPEISSEAPGRFSLEIPSASKCVSRSEKNES